MMVAALSAVIPSPIPLRSIRKIRGSDRRFGR
ncbi:hypothetical protein RB2654_13935 [Rhodobacterales bacterium HTCC2654]|uniref:Uncharacterized protein n=1 Tax=Maritimibacter alkaliphilus HTCC2654 TaxID=314271 RepID=A3VGI6_9RHOB|nr:hypothetical protein RB2654_13935 [Rhodobacterales bacterium HTCC2654] [Maritimibacter alkaliphilus HTCC2654]